jgi:hypothetical protein
MSKWKRLHQRNQRTTFRLEEINAPVSWCCVDCGVNTAPGMANRAEIHAHFLKTAIGLQGSVDEQSELYVVHPWVWERSGLGGDGGCLCVGCLERRIGRALTPDDFTPDATFNSTALPCTRRLAERRWGVGPDLGPPPATS